VRLSLFLTWKTIVPSDRKWDAVSQLKPRTQGFAPSTARPLFLGVRPDGWAVLSVHYGQQNKNKTHGQSDVFGLSSALLPLQWTKCDSSWPEQRGSWLRNYRGRSFWNKISKLYVCLASPYRRNQQRDPTQSPTSTVGFKNAWSYTRTPS